MTSGCVVEAHDLGIRFARSMRRSLRYGIVDIVRSVFPGAARGEHLRADEFWALRDVNFSLRAGESLGVIGRNGAGKSTLLKLLAGIYTPTTGRLSVRGRVGSIIELGASFTPTLSGRENLRPMALLNGYDDHQIRRRTEEIIAFADLGKFIDAPVQHYSTGMRARLGFAIAVHAEPDVLLIDEVLAVGDIAFQNKCLRKVEHFCAQGGAVVFVGHSTHQMQVACERGMVLDAGQVRFSGSAVEAIDAYLATQRSVEADGRRSGGEFRIAGDDTVRVTELAFEVAQSVGGRGPQCCLRMTVELAKPIEGFSVGMQFLTADDMSTVAGAGTVPGTLAAGRHRLRVDLLDLPLVRGRYVARLTVLGGDPPYPLWFRGVEDSPVGFEIAGAASAATNLMELGGARVWLDARLTSASEGS